MNLYSNLLRLARCIWPNGYKLINQFKKIAVLPEEEKTLVLKMITAYIRDFNTQQAYAS